MKYKILVGLLVASLVLTSTTSVRAQGITIPDWVPEKVAGWTLAYNGSISTGLSLGKASIVKTNWTQLWFKNTSAALTGVVGVVDYEYTEDFFSKELPTLLKTFLGLGLTGVGYSLPAFNGTTRWDLFEWLMGIPADLGYGLGFDANPQVTGATNAFSVNLTWGGTSFYLLYAYKGVYASMVFAVDFGANIISWYENHNMTQLWTYYEPYLGMVSNCLGTLMTMFASWASYDPSLGSIEASIASITPAGGITPTASVATSAQEVNTFGSNYFGQLPGGIPGYSVFLVGIASFFAVLVIVQKKRKAIVA